MDFVLSMIICEILYTWHLKYIMYVFAAAGIFLTFHSYVAKFTNSTLANCYLY